MKKTLRILALALVFVMTVSMLCACVGTDNTTGPAGTNGNNGGSSSTNKPDGPQNPTDKYASIAGEYYLDAAALGMPMAWYVKVSANGDFVIANKRDYETAANIKGKGSIGDKDGIYMFLYEDSTPDKPKTATFTIDNGNLVFSTSVPVGAASVSPKEENGVTTYPTALAIGAEEHLGTYMGEYLKESAMAGNVLYSYELELDYGYTYHFESSFVMAGMGTFTWTETGHFAVDGTKITFTPDAEDATPAEGTIENKKITAAFRLSQMGKTPQEIEAEFAPYADVAGQYSNYKSMMGTDFYTFLTLKGNGDYTYAAYAAGEAGTTHTDEGKFTMEGNTITLTSSVEGVAPISGTIENYTISGDAFKIPLYTGTPAAKQVFHAEHAQGIFSAKSTTEGGVEYTAELTLAGNTFKLALTAAGAEAPAYELEGTFEIVKAMGAMTMNLTVTTENPIFANATAAVSENAINIELPFDPDDSAKLGFQMEQQKNAYDAFLPAPGGDMGGGMGGGMGGMG